ncbi:homeobox protein 5-like [Drosophila yakuba]|uniref:homeobox protein 5-like n=1 Tax=Drosophila yakuba TaxID=7245 RepID=UPI001C89E817|nr:homeobox protein 5-like [Drosophila yakuba]
MALNAFVSALKGSIGVTIRNMGVPNIAKAYEIACREKNLGALEETEPEPKPQGSTESVDKSTKETPSQGQEREEPQRQGSHRESTAWPHYQWGNNQPSFPMPFGMPNFNGWPGFGLPYPMMGNPFKVDNFNQGESSGYQGPYRNHQNGNSRWNQSYTNRDRQWNRYNNGYNNNRYNNGYYNNNGRGQLAIESPANAEGSGQSRMSRNSNSSGQSRRSYHSTNTSDRNYNRSSVGGQLHNIQEEGPNFPQAASNNQQDT